MYHWGGLGGGWAALILMIILVVLVTLNLVSNTPKVSQGLSRVFSSICGKCLKKQTKEEANP
jgi:hypothetical protein